MKIENVNEAKKLGDELDNMRKAISPQGWSGKNDYNTPHHFEYYEDYGSNSRHIVLPERLNKEIFEVIRKNIPDVIKEIEKL